MHNPATHILAALDAQEPAIWIVVTSARGSVPREAGASMLVTAARTVGTIGGGHLELKAIEVARERIASSGNRVTQRHFPLGPALGQCCGGAVDVAFVAVTSANRDDWLRLRDIEQQGGTFHWSLRMDTGDTLTLELDFSPWNVWVFGAGHVGRAIVDILATLPCGVTWVDSREEPFPLTLPAGVSARESNDPAGEVRRIPAGSDVLVLTHSHALDFDITLALLKRDDLGYVGVIGSATKAATFRKRLVQRGLTDGEIMRMVSPIGRPLLAGNNDWAASKHPGVIAVSVASTLIERHQLATSRRVQMRAEG